MPIPDPRSNKDEQEPPPSGTGRPPNLQPDTSNPPFGLLAKFKPILTVLGGVLLLITGGIFGALYINGDRAVELSSWLLAAAGFVVATAFLLIVCLFVVKQWLVPPLGQTAKRLMERIAAAAPQTRVVNNEEGGYTLSAPELDEELGQSLKDDAQTLLSAFLITRAYWRTLVILGTLIGSAVITAQLLVMIEQTERLTQQNDLIQQEGQLVSLQAQLDAINSKAELDLKEAQREYDEITTILFEGTSPAAQEYALVYQLPEAMLMSVTIVDPAWAPPAPSSDSKEDSYRPKTITLYPNLRRLAEQLLVFAKNDRLTEPGAGDFIDTGVPSGGVSTAIIRALHRFGVDRNHTDLNSQDNDSAPVESQLPTCIWDIIFQHDGSVYANWEDRARAHLLPEMRKHKLTLLESPGGVGSSKIDLRHLKQNQLNRAQLQEADLTHAQLQGVQLYSAKLQGADLKHSQLQGAGLSYAQLQEADLTYAQLQGVQLYSAELQGVDLRDAQLQGANLSLAGLQGADLRDAQLQGARLNQAQLQGADLRDAQLQGANLSLAGLQGADCRRANMEAGSFDLVINDYSEPYWEKYDYQFPSSGERRLFFVPSAQLKFIKIGAGVAFKYPDTSQEFQTIVDEFKHGKLRTVFWSTRQEAEAAIIDRLGKEFLKYLVPQKTIFEGAKLDGVLIDQETLNGLLDDDLDIAVAEAFENAVTAPVKVIMWDPFRLPDPAETLGELESE